MQSKKIVILAHNIRSSHNVGSLIRTAEGLGLAKVIVSGYTPYPIIDNDNRLPHLAKKQNQQILKTALGAEKYIKLERVEDPFSLIKDYRNNGYAIIGLEQDNRAIKLNEFKAPDNILLLIGSEVSGIDSQLLEVLDKVIEIPMLGHKESFNLVQATAICLYHFQFGS